MLTWRDVHPCELSVAVSGINYQEMKAADERNGVCSPDGRKAGGYGSYAGWRGS